MASPKRFLSLNLGMQTVGMAEFTTDSKGGLVLGAFNLTELLADPAAEASRIAQLRIAIGEMLAGTKRRHGKVNYAISAQSVFTRFVKLPPVEQDKVDQIITFEAQQNVPFPIDEVVWDYQLVGGKESGKLEVVLVAIKADLLNDLNEAVEDSGLETDTVEVAPMALYNAFRYNYSDLEGCSLLVDIGARTTNLIFIEPGKVFSRSIPIGGTSISASIAKEFEESFAEAEERKKKVAFVGLGGAYAEPSDPDIARVSKMVRNTMTRVHAEISRSISFYRSQQQGSAPVQVFLCGGGASLPYMREFFTEKLQMPVEFFNPIRNVAVAQPVDAELAGKSAHVLGELVGLALRSISECPMELCLRPASVERRKLASRRRPYLSMAVVCFLLTLGGAWFYLKKAADIMEALTERKAPQLASLQAVKAKFDKTAQEIEATKKKALPYLAAVEARDFWVRLLDDLHSRVPESFVWITLLESGYFGADGKFSASPPSLPPQTGAQGASKQSASFGLRIRGLYLDNPNQAGVVDQFVKNLSESPYISKAEVMVRATPTSTEWAYDYELRVELKSNTGI